MKTAVAFGLERGIGGWWAGLGVKAIRVKTSPSSAGAAQLLHQANRLRTEIRIFGKMLKKLHQLFLRF